MPLINGHLIVYQMNTPLQFACRQHPVRWWDTGAKKLLYGLFTNIKLYALSQWKRKLRPAIRLFVYPYGCLRRVTLPAFTLSCHKKQRLHGDTHWHRIMIFTPLGWLWANVRHQQPSAAATLYYRLGNVTNIRSHIDEPRCKKEVNMKIASCLHLTSNVGWSSKLPMIIAMVMKCTWKFLYADLQLPRFFRAYFLIHPEKCGKNWMRA